jgi:hypothetical protein
VFAIVLLNRQSVSTRRMIDRHQSRQCVELLMLAERHSHRQSGGAYGIVLTAARDSRLGLGLERIAAHALVDGPELTSAVS